MTTVQTIQPTQEIFEWTRKAFGEAEEEAAEYLNKRKMEIIVNTAGKLEEAGIEKNKICMEIIRNLHDIVGESWVRKVLNNHPEYKDQKHRGNILKRYSQNKVEGVNPSTKSGAEDGDPWLALSRQPVADIANGEIEQEQEETNFSQEEWHPEDHFDVKRIATYKNWQLVKTLKYGFYEKGWKI